MIDSCCKCNLRWFEGVVCRKMNCQKEYTALIWAVIRSHNCGLPMKHIIPNWTCRTLCWRVTGQITKFLINPFQRQSLCFASGSSLSRSVLKGPDKTLDYPGSREGIVSSSHTGSARHRHWRAGASLKLRPWPPPCAAAGASPALRGSCARHSPLLISWWVEINFLMNQIYK